MTHPMTDCSDPRTVCPATPVRAVPCRRFRATWTAALLAPAFAWAVGGGPAPDRQADLIRIVRQDCGSCHGMQLTGGLGPALTRQALADKPVDSLVATIVHGRPGTPMPPWRTMLSDAEAAWIVDQLLRGFPHEPGSRR